MPVGLGSYKLVVTLSGEEKTYSNCSAKKKAVNLGETVWWSISVLNRECTYTHMHMASPVDRSTVIPVCRERPSRRFGFNIEGQ
eukprot:2478038-Pyramimonas_sp.AAC.1